LVSLKNTVRLRPNAATLGNEFRTLLSTVLVSLQNTVRLRHNAATLGNEFRTLLSTVMVSLQNTGYVIHTTAKVSHRRKLIGSHIISCNFVMLMLKYQVLAVGIARAVWVSKPEEWNRFSLLQTVQKGPGVH